MAAKNSAAKIMQNSIWLGLEQILEVVVFFGTSIAVARYLGKDKLGYFSYINFLVMTVNRTGGTGLAGATRKYMAEFLARDEPGIARSVYDLAFRYQLLGGLVITACSLAGIAIWGEPGFKLMSAILILSMLPGVMSWVPAQANQALEDVSQNTLSSLGYLSTYTITILLTLYFKWDLIGVASASLVGRTVEAVWRVIPLHRRLGGFPKVTMPDELKFRMRRFFLQAMGIQIVASVVWDRSELVFLRHFSSLGQMAFYSVSCGLAGNLLMVPRTFGAATGITLMVESGRDPGRINSIVRNSCRYLFLIVFPVHIGAAVIASRAIAWAYGAQYAPAGPVLVIAAVLAMPRAFLDIPDTLLRTFDKVGLLLKWMIITGVVNIAFDWLLIPKYAAAGAAWGNGLGQAFGIVALWIVARRFCVFHWPVSSMLRLGGAACTMGLVAWAVQRAIPGILGMWIAVAVAVPVYILMVKLLQGLESTDAERLGMIGRVLPGPARRTFLALIGYVVPREIEAGVIQR